MQKRNKKNMNIKGRYYFFMMRIGGVELEEQGKLLEKLEKLKIYS